LSVRAIRDDGCRLVGWIANRIDPAMRCADANLASLRERIAAPLLGVLAHASGGRHEGTAADLDVSRL
ncbi:MAG: dethiobiotin synthase, partial [Lysobacterales bacterium]